MAYEVILSVGGQKDYDHAIDYFLYELKNPQAAIGLIDDFTEVANHLKRAADSYPSTTAATTKPSSLNPRSALSLAPHQKSYPTRIAASML